MSDETHIKWHDHAVSRTDREQLAGHQGCVIWLTGLSGCGKSTIANLVDHQLAHRGVRSFVLDGDNIRHSLNASPAMLADAYGDGFARRFGLGFSADDRSENIRRISAVAQLFCSAGIVTITAFISPYRKDRDAARRLVESQGRPGDFIEIYVNAPLEVCESRDPKGLYRKARAGEIRQFTGIDDPYEAPLSPELELPAGNEPATQLAEHVVGYLIRSGTIPA